MIYHDLGTQLTECYCCGEKKPCQVSRADHPEAETGYVDEYAICFDCINAEPE